MVNTKGKRDTDTWFRIRQRLTSVKLLCADGATNGQIADYLGVSINTIVLYRHKYPEFDECFRLGRGEVVEKLEGKLYQKAMGIVDTNIVKEIITKSVEEVEDPETGEITEVEKVKKKQIQIKESGQGEADISAIQFLLRVTCPEKYNVQPTQKDEIEPIQLCDTVPEEVNATDAPKLYYDDSKDEKSEDNIQSGN